YAYSLSQNYPNPFNPTTTISYSIKSPGLVSLKVYDILGTEVASLVNENQEAGNYSVEFNAYNLTSGIYFYTLTSGNFVETKKLILLK
ncbi:MAG: T9SS type A sorting domain-containing protein, partial [Ignavibacteriaceae bacterium]|nr:T9SS type A sorting domain-containing protein [Ignavibacteriaceae bacterium]